MSAHEIATGASSPGRDVNISQLIADTIGAEMEHDPRIVFIG